MVERALRDSGVKWIGNIPNSWNIKRFKFIKKDSNVGESIDKSLYSENEEGYVFYMAGANPIKTSYMNFPIWKYVKPNDLLLARNGTPYVYLPEEGAVYSDHVIRTSIDKKYDRRFIRYCLQRSISNTIVDTVSIATWSISLWNEQYLPIPCFSEQVRIANFLDSKCDEIDSLTKDIEHQIETLEEYKKSVITEAVTRGLEPDVPMKDSGVEWIGKIPETWNVDKIKYHLRRNEEKNHSDATVLSVYREYGVIPKDSRDDNHNVTSEDTSKYKFVRIGNLVINKMKAWQGSLAVSEYEGIVSPAYFIYEFIDKKLNKKYFHYLIRCCYKDEFRRISGGIREGQWDLPSDLFENELITIPSIDEQNKIVQYLEKEIDTIESIIVDKQKQLDTLAEYKKSLIYEYVTGKKEVPA